jgi:hypothetical protein
MNEPTETLTPEVVPTAGDWIKRSSKTIFWLGLATLLLGVLAMAAPMIPGLTIAIKRGC